MPEKEYKTIQARVTHKIMEIIERYCAERDLTVSQFIRKAALHFLDKENEGEKKAS